MGCCFKWVHLAWAAFGIFNMSCKDFLTNISHMSRFQHENRTTFHGYDWILTWMTRVIDDSYDSFLLGICTHTLEVTVQNGCTHLRTHNTLGWCTIVPCMRRYAQHVVMHARLREREGGRASINIDGRDIDACPNLKNDGEWQHCEY